MRDLESTDLAGAAYLAAGEDPGWDDRPSPAELADGPAEYVPARCAECGAPATREGTATRIYSIGRHEPGCSEFAGG